MTTQHNTLCLHCDEPTTRKDSFCCSGCKTVYQLLHTSQLDHFYTLKKDGISFKPTHPVQTSNTDFKYLDSEDILTTYSSNETCTLPFYIEGLHCHACIWLIEKLPTLVDDIHSAQVNIGQNTLILTRHPHGLFSNAAKVLDTLGYKVHLQEHDTKQRIQDSSIKTSLMRIGIAAACMANIMIFSISIYAGLQDTLKTIFEWISAFLMIPVLGYCSAPFFKSAYAAFRIRHMNIDIPITIALLVGGSMSYINLLRGEGDLYFDSLSMFIFLVLSVRHLFLSSYQKLDYHTALTASLIPYEAWLCTSTEPRRVLTRHLQPQDVILVKSGEAIPVDGTIQTSGYVDVHILTGESLPVQKSPGDAVLAGMKNSGGDILISVEKVGDKTRLGTLLTHINTVEKPKLVQMADKVAHWFLLITLTLAMGIFIVQTFVFHNLNLGLQSALALIVLACPCALSLATPLAYAMSINRLTQEGVCVQSPTVLDTLTDIKTIYFDKTGTLTKGEFTVVKEIQYHSISKMYDIIYALEKESHHPIASCLRRFVLPKIGSPISMQNIKETIGKGLSGLYNYKTYELRGTKKHISDVITSIGLFENNALVAEFLLSDSILDDAFETIQSLQAAGYDVILLSGDQDSCVHSVQTQLGIRRAYSELQPEDKVTIIQNTPHSLMIGDGANDTQALMEASASIAAQGSFEASLKAADVYLVSKDLTQIPKLMKMSIKTKHVIWTNFIFSLIYNVTGIALVLLGYIHPLIAAILMPISSLTVILYSWFKLGS